MELSVVVPVYNERDSLEELVERLKKEIVKQGFSEYEIWMIDDGSNDGSDDVIKKIAKVNSVIKMVRLRCNLGKTLALKEGFRRVKGKLVLTIDADLQDRPENLEALLNKLNEGFDVVVGWKQRRLDPWHKVGPSRIFNWVVNKLVGLGIHDMNCGLKLMKLQVVKELTLYGELHRFIPLLAKQRGFKIAEVKVKHDARRYGVSKYGWGRMIAGLFDLMTQLFLIKFGKRPGHYFGILGALMTLGGVLAGLYLTIIWFMGQKIGGRPLLNLVVLLIVIGIQTLSFGFLSELLVGLKMTKDELPIEEDDKE